MGQVKFSFTLKKNNKSETKTYKCLASKIRWQNYYREQGHKVISL